MREQLCRRLYYRRGPDGELLESSMEDVFQRVASTIYPTAGAGREALLRVLNNRQAVFNTPVLVNAGKEHFQAAACFILETEDSLDSLIGGVGYAAKIYSQTSGCGFDYSNIRPAGLTTGGGALTSGPVAFMRLLDRTGDTITSGWGARRAACLVQLDDVHPDLLDFIRSKDSGDLTNMNISVRITNRLDHLPPETFMAICESAWRTGDPGLIFGRICDQRSPIQSQGRALHNPCAEVCLPVDGIGNACNLASINVYRMWGASGFDWDLLKQVVPVMIRAQDEIVDLAYYPVPGMDRVVKYSRPLGLGITGFGLLLMRLGVAYGSPCSIDWIDQVTRCVHVLALEESIQMAEEKGPCPAWSNIQDRDSILRLAGETLSGDSYQRLIKFGIRNAYVTSIAPTGSISWVLGCEAAMGIEPGYALVYVKTAELEGETTVINPEFERQVLSYVDAETRDELMRRVLANAGSVKGLDCADLEMPPEPRDLLVGEVLYCAHDISWKRHLDVLAAAVPHVSQSISKSVNLPYDVTVEDIRNLYLYAEEHGIKNIAVFRDRCKGNLESFQPMSTCETADLQTCSVC